MNKENKMLCDVAGNNISICMQLMMVDEAKTDMEYCCNSCNKSYCELNPMVLGMVPAFSGRK
ncbi:hypothetical protein [Ruminiclostridium josui]|uniref:hypothetical protein n=1 Tax=Ruminiclostridium josui TaxID=1499 RepID=UPI0004B02131|nr:hypothetical protein [Ruminiclostridium josui]